MTVAVDKSIQTYTKIFDDNLFEPLLPEVKSDFEKADGGELEN